MTSSKPYILRALHEWISDNEFTPLILVDSRHEDILIPPGIDEDGKVVLNISFGATHNLELINEGVLFDARFSGVSHNIFIPIESILAIYARESGQGMMFSEEDQLPEPPPTSGNDGSGKDKARKDEKKAADKSFLKVVK